MEKLTNCPVCNSQEQTSFIECVDHTVSNETFQIVICNECNFKFTNPRPSQEEITRYYQSKDYYSHNAENPSFIGKIYGLARRVMMAKKVRLVNRLIGTNQQKMLFDYGCGTGSFVAACKNAGWIASGLEPSEKARTYAITKENIDVVNDLASIASDAQFNIITLWHVLEHIHELNETFEKLISHLAPNGKLVIAVPNAMAYEQNIFGKHWAAYDVPRHLYHFEHKSMSRFLEKHGCQISEIRTMPLDGYYISLLSQKYKTGSTDFFNMLWNGAKSQIASIYDKHLSSSLLYIIKKK